MTDAERWRAIAADFAAGDPHEWDGLCIATTWLKPYNAASAWRMDEALELFRPEDADGPYWWGRECWGFDGSEYDPDARILAACFLAAMADADGGNHAPD